MRLLRFSGKQRKLKPPLLLRQIVGKSMLPSFREGGLLVASGWFKDVKPHDVVIVLHEGKEKVKRVHKVRNGELFLLGDNGAQSTDSRDFGWLPLEHITAKVIWPRIETTEF
jgi:phage repressor protein C with HTH and peptisase S24 domain